MTSKDSSNLPSSLKEAQEQGSPYYFTGKACKHGHIARRQTSNCACIECNREIQQKWRDTHRERRPRGSHNYYFTESKDHKGRSL